MTAEPADLPADDPVEGLQQASTSVLLSSLSLVAGKVATMGFGFLAWIVAARLYPADVVGLASGAVAAVTLCAQFALVGVGSAVITLLPRHRERPGALLDTAVGYLTLTAAVAAIAFLLVAGTVLNELRVVANDPLFALLFVALAVGGTLGVLFDQASTARRRGEQVLLRGVIAGVITLATVAGVGSLVGAGTVPVVGTGSRDIFAAWAVGGIVTCALGLALIGRAVPGYRVRPTVDRVLAAQLTRVGFPNYLLTLAERAPGFVLPIVVTELLSPTENAAWYAAWMMAWVVFVIPVQVGMTSFAEIAREPSRAPRIVRQGVLTSLGMGIAGAAALFVVAEPILGLLGSQYAEEGALPLRVLVLGIVPLTVVQAYFSLGRARRDLRGPIALGTAGSIASILIPAAAGLASGLVGMAVAWLAVQVLTAVAAGWGLRRLTRL